MEIIKGRRVRLEYEVKIKGGEVVETSTKSGPIEYVHGDGRMLPGLERRLEGKKTGAALDGEIPAAEVFGPEDAFPTMPLARAELPKEADVAVGATFAAKTAAGAPVSFKVTALDDKTVTVRLLPPIFGKDLVFHAKVLMVEDPATGQSEIVVHKPPPPPAAALAIDVEEEK